MSELLRELRRSSKRYTLPVSGLVFSGWKDYDRPVLTQTLALEDKVFYLRKRLELIAFNSLDQIYLRSSPRHDVVNGPDMSFFFIGATICCCCIEALGGFVTGTERPNQKNFDAFLASYMTKWHGKTLAGVDVPRWLWHNLRNGLAHGLVIQEGGLDDLKDQRVKDVAPGKIVVHAELLYADLKQGAERFFSDLMSGGDPPLNRRFEARFHDIFQVF